jgi:hypothetical protein
MDYFDGLKQGFDLLILECFEPGIQVSISTNVSFTTDVSIDTMTLCNADAVIPFTTTWTAEA